MKFKLLIFPILFLFIFSCKKDVTILPCESGLNNSYFPMTVGSYWVYQWYKVDFVEEEETKLEGKIDTIKVLKDTLIGYNNYACESIVKIDPKRNSRRNFAKNVNNQSIGRPHFRSSLNISFFN